jgi:hypothetical protein
MSLFTIKVPNYNITNGVKSSFPGLDADGDVLLDVVERTSHELYAALPQSFSVEDLRFAILKHYTSAEWAAANVLTAKLHEFLKKAKTGTDVEIIAAIKADPPLIWATPLGRLSVVGQIFFRVLQLKENNLMSVLVYLTTHYKEETLAIGAIKHKEEGNVWDIARKYGALNPAMAAAMLVLLPEPAPAPASPPSKKRPAFSPIVDDASVPHPCGASPPGAPMLKKQKSVHGAFSPSAPGVVPAAPAAVGIGHPSAKKAAAK